MYRPNTLKDIADDLGLSVSTVSRALSDSYQISDKTKKRVRDCAAEMNYKPNPFAVRLKSTKNYSLGIVVSSVDNTFFSQVIDGIESVAYKSGYNVIITQSHDSSVREAENIRHLMNSRVDGILLSLAAGTVNYSHINDYKSKGNPMVFFDRVISNHQSNKVVSDNFKGAYQGITLLIKSGYKRILFLGSVEHLYTIEERKLGYQQALLDNLMSSQSCVRYCGFEKDYIGKIGAILKELLTSDNKPDAIFGACESTTFGCLLVLKKLKLDDGIKIIGFSNSDVSGLMCSSPNFIKQNAFKMGAIAAEKLINSIENKAERDKYETVMLDTFLDN